ncbi:MAG: alkaline phosphatase D family protein [Pseudomonadota bacterium]|nr:alkaline phosphatase D family protein [Pseudomonadota bacterium]
MDRRTFLRGIGWVSGSALLPLLTSCDSSEVLSGGTDGNDISAEFLHGVASGDPLADRVILWTRVTPERNAPVRVRYRVARDPLLAEVLIDAYVITDESRDFTVKVDAAGLQAATTYYYQFETGSLRSPIGRTKTLPVGAVERLRFAFTSCSNYPAGYFSAYRHMAARTDLDAVFHLGDYLYEGGGGGVDGRDHSKGAEIVTLDDYRARHAQYRGDQDLQAMTRQHPMICVWDDHESTNDSWNGGAQNHQPDTEGDWFERKSVSIQAYFEWLPIRLVDPADTQRIWRQFVFGDLVDLMMLDTRLYGREEQVPQAVIGEVNDPNRQLLGDRQQDWLSARLVESAARWKLLGQQIMFGQLRLLTLPQVDLLGVELVDELLAINADQWDGYPAARQRVFDAIDAGQVQNLVVLTGDIHTSWGIDLFRDPGELANLLANTIGDPLDLGLIKADGVEFVSPSVTSSGFPDGTTPLVRAVFGLTDPHVKYFDGERHGYVLLDITHDRCQGEWWYVDSIIDPQAAESFGHARYTLSGESRLREAAEPSTPRLEAPPPAPGLTLKLGTIR